MHLLADTLREIYYYLRQYKTRTFMTMFGIVWGTFSIIVLLAFSNGIRSAMSKNMHGIGEGIAILWPGRTSMPFMGFGRDRYIRLLAEDAELLRQQIPELAAISPEYSTWQIPIRVGDKVNKPNISGVIPEYGPMRNIQPTAGGRWIDELDNNERKRVVFLGNELCQFLLGENVDPIGKYVHIGDSPFLVIGVMMPKTQPSSYSARDQDRAFIPANTFASMFGHRYINNIVYKPADPRKAEYVRNRIYQVLGNKKAFAAHDKQALHIWDTTEMDQFILYFSLGFTIFMGLIGTMTLAIGGIGLANIMYIVVQERTFEIGIRRSVGAKRQDILSQFLLEAFLIISSSAAIGFLISFVFITMIRFLPFEEYIGIPSLNLMVAFSAFFILGIVGLLAGFFPARKAAGLNVIDCLRQG